MSRRPGTASLQPGENVFIPRTFFQPQETVVEFAIDVIDAPSTRVTVLLLWQQEFPQGGPTFTVEISPPDLVTVTKFNPANQEEIIYTNNYHLPSSLESGKTYNFQLFLIGESLELWQFNQEGRSTAGPVVFHITDVAVGTTNSIYGLNAGWVSQLICIRDVNDQACSGSGPEPEDDSGWTVVIVTVILAALFVVAIIMIAVYANQ